MPVVNMILKYEEYPSYMNNSMAKQARRNIISRGHIYLSEHCVHESGEICQTSEILIGLAIS